MATWNAHSVYNKRPVIEVLLHTQGLDVLCVTESWLNPEDVWEVPGFMSYRADRPEGQGGGVLILVSRAFQVSRVVSSLGRRREVSCVGLVLPREQGQVAVFCVKPPSWSCDRWGGVVLVFGWDVAI